MIKRRRSSIIEPIPDMNYIHNQESEREIQAGTLEESCSTLHNETAKTIELKGEKSTASQKTLVKYRNGFKKISSLLQLKNKPFIENSKAKACLSTFTKKGQRIIQGQKNLSNHPSFLLSITTKKETKKVKRTRKRVLSSGAALEQALKEKNLIKAKYRGMYTKKKGSNPGSSKREMQSSKNSPVYKKAINHFPVGLGNNIYCRKVKDRNRGDQTYFKRKQQLHRKDKKLRSVRAKDEIQKNLHSQIPWGRIKQKQKEVLAARNAESNTKDNNMVCVRKEARRVSGLSTAKSKNSDVKSPSKYQPFSCTVRGIIKLESVDSFNEKVRNSRDPSLKKQKVISGKAKMNVYSIIKNKKKGRRLPCYIKGTRTAAPSTKISFVRMARTRENSKENNPRKERRKINNYRDFMKNFKAKRRKCEKATKKSKKQRNKKTRVNNTNRSKSKSKSKTVRFQVVGETVNHVALKKKIELREKQKNVHPKKMKGKQVKILGSNEGNNIRATHRRIGSYDMDKKMLSRDKKKRKSKSKVKTGSLDRSKGTSLKRKKSSDKRRKAVPKHKEKGQPTSVDKKAKVILKKTSLEETGIHPGFSKSKSREKKEFKGSQKIYPNRSQNFYCNLRKIMKQRTGASKRKKM